MSTTKVSVYIRSCSERRGYILVSACFATTKASKDHVQRFRASAKSFKMSSNIDCNLWSFRRLSFNDPLPVRRAPESDPQTLSLPYYLRLSPARPWLEAKVNVNEMDEEIGSSQQDHHLTRSVSDTNTSLTPVNLKVRLLSQKRFLYLSLRKIKLLICDDHRASV